MRIRAQLSPARRRLVGAATVSGLVVLWFLVTLQLFPAPPQVIQSTLEQSSSAIGVADRQQQAAERRAAEMQPETSTRRPLIPASILPSPQQVVLALVYLHREEALVRSALVSLLRITVAFLLAALLAIPLGILMGTYPPLKAAIEPISGPLRFLPVSAITGLFILLFGIGEEMKVTFLFVGIVVYLLPMVIESVQNVDDVYLETAYTLGAKPSQSILRVLVPGAWPGIFEASRVIYGIGWTYVILAELINAKYGLGYLITIAYRRGHIDWAYALVFVVLLLGVATNEVFRRLSTRLFAWKEA